MNPNKRETDMGTNRTGIQTSPLDSQALLDATSQMTPTSGPEQAIVDIRGEYSRVSEPMGTMPPPGNVRGVVQTTKEMLKGHRPAAFLDKLGERLAFERTGVRLYDALLGKLDVFGSWDGGPTRADLEHFRTEELAHLGVVREAIERLGGDPTALTPSANLHAVASLGLVQVLSDPRTNLRQGLEAILIAELADNDCWVNLTSLAQALGQEAMAAQFQRCLNEEQQHLASVRRWIATSLAEVAQVSLEPQPLPAP